MTDWYRQGEQRNRDLVTDRTMWPRLIVALQFLPRIGQRHEPMRIEALGTQPTIERLDEHIVRRLAGSREVQDDIVSIV